MTPIARTAGAAGQAPPAAEGDRALREAARQFEGILLRQMLAEMQKTTKMGGGGPGAGGQLYATLVSEALADAVLQAGGLGLTESLVGSLGGERGQGGIRPAAQKVSQGLADAAVPRDGHVPDTAATQDSSVDSDPRSAGVAGLTGHGPAAGPKRETVVATTAPYLHPEEDMLHQTRALQPGRTR